MDIYTMALGSACGFSWCGAYAVAFLRGYLDETYVVPLPAILANVSWEILYGTIFRNNSPVGPIVPLAWLAIDLGLLFQAVKYGRKDFINIDKSTFLLLIISGFAISGGVLYYANIENILWVSSAFPQNLMMSILFIQMLLSRNDARGQSIYVAILKLFGTLSAILMAFFPITNYSGINTVTYLGILFFDTVYLILLYKKLGRLKIVPWNRF